MQVNTNQPDRQLEVPWDNPGLLVVPGGVASQLQDLGSQVFHDCRHVHWSTSANSLRIVALPTQTWVGDHTYTSQKKPEQSVDPAHWELKSCPAGARLCLSLDLTALSTSRHG